MQINIAGPSETALLKALRNAQAQAIDVTNGDGALTTIEICGALGLDEFKDAHRRRVHILLHKLQQSGVDLETVYVPRPSLLGIRPTPGYRIRIKQNSIDNEPVEC